MIPAIVRYIGKSNDKFTTGNEYEAFFLEYWQGVRHSIHVRDNYGEISDFIPFEDFKVVSDEDNVLNLYEAIVKCISHKYEDTISGLIYGKEYTAIGCDKDGLFLVMDESFDCYFYPSDIFEVINDEHSILKRNSVYYSCNAIQGE